MAAIGDVAMAPALPPDPSAEALNRHADAASSSGHHVEVPSEVLQEFRQAFSHLDSQEEMVCGWLTDAQKAALAKMFQVRGLEPKEHFNASQLPDATAAEVEQVELFRKRIEDEGHLADERARAYCGDLTLLKYLRAREHNLNPKGRVVVYSSFSHTNERLPDKVTINAACLMEKSCQCMAANSPAQVIWVNNFCGRHKRGFTWSDANPRFFFSGLNVFMDNYPECLKTMVIVDPPHAQGSNELFGEPHAQGSMSSLENH